MSQPKESIPSTPLPSPQSNREAYKRVVAQLVASQVKLNRTLDSYYCRFAPEDQFWLIKPHFKHIGHEAQLRSIL